ncbi:hypothetical protein [Streptomyces sp. NPDC051636]|uniref:hypothetical protein n=1 Tax=Streptomyces sp. NPDC051636 TaxID=3365663 RepID=UPI0037BCE59B
MEHVPEQMVEFVRRQVELPEGTLPLYRADRHAKHHRGPDGDSGGFFDGPAG